jgi:microcystin degradation protein MlrC
MSSPRVGIAGIWHETNTYSSRLAGWRQFEEFELLAGEAIVERHRGTRSVIGGFLDACPYELAPAFTAGAWPAGAAPRTVAEELLGRLRAGLAAAAPLDGLLLNLHGAMVAEGHPDMERDVLEVVREAAGGLPVAAVLDLHGNPSVELAARCDALLAYDTYPHVDMWERGSEAAGLLAAMLDGRRLRTHVAKLPLLTSPLAQETGREPMRGLLDLAGDLARRAAGRPGIARVSLLPGFPYSDVERAGFSVLVIADEGADAQARAVLEELAAAVEARAGEFSLTRPGPAEAVRRAAAAAAGPLAGPVVLADVADNIGGGSAGDGTAILAELLAQRVRGAVVLIADAAVACRAAELGVGATVVAEVGGGTDRLHGAPVPVEGVVEAVSDGRYRSGGTWMTGREFCMGTTAVLGCGGVRLVVMERATPPFHREQLTSVGIQPERCAVIAVKGAVAWRAAYGDVAAEVIEVDTPGVCPLDPHVLPRATTPLRARSL